MGREKSPRQDEVVGHPKSSSIRVKHRATVLLLTVPCAGCAESDAESDPGHNGRAGRAGLTRQRVFAIIAGCTDETRM